VTDAKIREHSLTARALALGVIPTLHTETVWFNPPIPPCDPHGCVPPAPGATQTATASCRSGTYVVGGGYSIPPGQGTEEVASMSQPVSQPAATSPSGGWEVTFTETASQTATWGGWGTVYAVCASVR
jgi:hypothetical protein